MTFYDAIDRACQEDTLAKALTYISLWECERVIPEAHQFLLGNKKRGPSGEGWNTCFEFLVNEVIAQYTVKKLIGK